MCSVNFQTSGDGESKNFVLLPNLKGVAVHRQMLLGLLTTGHPGKKDGT